ncbi:restriction endonuclease subunit S [Ursidibacter sp. B-7004-1]
MSSWKNSKLSEVIHIIGGGTPKRSEKKYWNGNIPWLSVADFNNDLRFVSSSAEYITELGLFESSTKLLKKGDLIISARGTVGCLAQLDKPMAFNQSCYGLNGKENIIDNGFLYYFLKNNIKELKQKTHGAVFDTITRDTFEYIKINYPNIERQKEIVNLLEDYDKKIQLNTQINQTLEQIAQTIFKSWFIDFDPVHAKANALANGQTTEQATLSAMAVISGKTFDELHRLQTENPEQHQQLWEIAEAFPNGFGEDGVPRGWEMTLVKSVCEKIQNGGTPKRSNKEYWNNGNIPWLSSGEVCNNNILISSKEFITQLGFENSSTKLIEANSTLIALYASPTAGKCSFCAFKATTNQAVCALVPKEIYKYFNFYYLQTKEKYYSNQAVGSAQQNISKNIVENTPILKPDGAILGYFNLMIGDLMNKQISNLKESDHLKNIRDELLPRLLSGDISNE